MFLPFPSCPTLPMQKELHEINVRANYVKSKRVISRDAGRKDMCLGDPGLIPELGRSSEEGNSYPLQYSCPENSMDRGAWWGTVHGIAKSQTQLSD